MSKGHSLIKLLGIISMQRTQTASERAANRSNSRWRPQVVAFPTTCTLGCFEDRVEMSDGARRSHAEVFLLSLASPATSLAPPIVRDLNSVSENNMTLTRFHKHSNISWSF